MIHLTNICFSPASEQDRARGVLGTVRCTVANAVVLDGLTLRYSPRGWPTIEFPERSNGGMSAPIARPLNERARRVLNHTLIAALRKQGVVP